MFRGFVLFSVLVLFVFTLGAQEEPKEDIRRLTATKGILTFWTPDAAKLRASWRKSFLAKLLTDEEMKPFLECLKKAHMSPSAFLDKVLKQHTETPLKDALEIFKGGLLLQLINIDTEAARVGPRVAVGDVVKFLFLLDAGSAKPTLEKLLTKGTDAIRKSAPEYDRPEKTKMEHKGTTIYGLGTEEAAFFGAFLKNTWAFTFDLDGMKQVIDRFKVGAGGATVLDDKSLKRMLEASGLKGKEEYLLWLDYAALMKKFEDELPRGGPERLMFDRLKKTIPQFLLVGAPEGNGYREVTVLGYPEGVPDWLKEKAEVPKGLLAEPDQILLFALSSAEALKPNFESFLDVTRLEAQMWGEPSPLDALAKKFEFDWKKDVFGQLKGTMQVYGVKPAGGGAFPEFFVVARLGDAQKVTALFDRLIEAAAKPLKEGEGMPGLADGLEVFKSVKKHKIGDLTLYAIETGGGDLPYNPTFGVVGDRLIFGTQPQVVRGVAKALKEPFAPNESYAKLLKEAEGCFSVMRLDMPKIAAYAYNTLIPLLRKNAKRDLEKYGIDLNLLPDVKSITRHFAPITSKGYLRGDLAVSEAVTESGFGFVGTVATVLSYIGLCAMASELDPEVMAMRRLQAMEMGIFMTMKMLTSAQEIYKREKGKYAESLEELMKRGLIDEWSLESIARTHKLVILGAAKDSWSAVANPKEGSPLKRYYYVDQTGVVRVSETEKIGPDSPVFEPHKRGVGSGLEVEPKQPEPVLPKPK